MRIISFSADGIKNAAEKGFYDWLKEQDADFVCIQDLQCSEYDLQDNIFFPEDYNAYFFDDVDDSKVAVATHEPGVEPLSKRETLELVRAYYRIPDQKTRNEISSLIKSLADSDTYGQEKK